MKDISSILFVCLGNICRSPLADGIANSIVSEMGLKLTIDSAGTGDWHIGEAPCEHSITVAKQHGIDISHLRARQVKPIDFKRFDLIVALDAKNFADLKRIGAQNLVKLGDYGFEGKDVPDPYFFDGFEGFENVFSMIQIATQTLLRSHTAPKM